MTYRLMFQYYLNREGTILVILRSIVTKVVKMSNVLLFFITFSMILLSTFIIFSIERETFPSLFDALWWVMTTVTTVGYGDFYPVSKAGRIFAMFLYIFGIGILGVVIGKIVDSFATIKKLKEEGKLKYTGVDHIVIFGWSKKSKIAIEEIINSDKKIEIVIIDQLPREPYDHDRVIYIQGDPSVDSTLMMANLKKAKAAIVFADDTIDNSVLVDGKSLLFVSAVENFAPDVYTVVEILREEHTKNFQHVNVDEFVLSHQMISRLLVQSTLQNGISDVISQLLSRSIGDDIYEISKKENWITYKDAVEELMANGATLIGAGNKLNVNEILHEKIPNDTCLRIICNNETYKKITSA
jgi:voltage-gated potassium channel